VTTRPAEKFRYWFEPAFAVGMPFTEVTVVELGVLDALPSFTTSETS
jgi:hypothetical protein